MEGNSFFETDEKNLIPEPFRCTRVKVHFALTFPFIYLFLSHSSNTSLSMGFDHCKKCHPQVT